MSDNATPASAPAAAPPRHNEGDKPEPASPPQEPASPESKPDQNHGNIVPAQSAVPPSQESAAQKDDDAENKDEINAGDVAAEVPAAESKDPDADDEVKDAEDDVPFVKGDIDISQASAPSSSAAPEGADAASSEGAAIPDPKVSELDAKEIQLSSEAVAELLDDDAAVTFRRAMALTLASGLAEVGGGADDAEATEQKAGVMLEEATRLFVLLLMQVPEDSQTCAGFAELLTGYGKSLLGFVRNSGQKQGVLGGKMEGGKPAEEDLEDQDDNEELAWTQLEAARVAFDRLVKRGEDKYNGRLGDVYGCLGDLLLEGDAWEAASREYETASQLMKGRRKAEVLYKQYLAMRRDAAAKALDALRESVRVFEEVESEEETIKELKEELSGYEAAVMPAVNNLKRGEKRAEDAIVATIVQPRKRAKKDK